MAVLTSHRLLWSLAVCWLPLALITGIDQAQFENQFIYEINLVRLQHMNTYILMREVNLTSTAQSYADSLASSGRTISKASDSDLTQCAAGVYAREKPILGDVATVLCGENLAYISNTNSNMTIDSCSPGSIVQKLWNSQRLYYNYTYPPTDTNGIQRVQDFTQMVWRQTRYVGIGVAFGNSNRTCYVVARFWPQGNLLNQFTTNVMPPISSSPARLLPARAGMAIFPLMGFVLNRLF